MKPAITDEEEKLVEDYIYKTYLIEVLESDHKAIESLNFKIKEPYEQLVESTLKRLRLDVKDIKVKFRDLKAKVEGPEIVNVEFLEYKYFVRGYHGIRRIFTYHFRNTASKLLEEYFTKKKDFEL
jgi:predicted nuclease with TOPRIM domain